VSIDYGLIVYSTAARLDVLEGDCSRVK